MMKKQKKKQVKCKSADKEIVAVTRTVSNQEKECADREQRRTTRFGALIAIIAIAGSVFIVLFKFALSTLNVLPEKSITYSYLIVFSLVILSSGINLLIDMLSYVYSDLKRHNIVSADYKRYDEESDKKYLKIINDCKMYVVILCILCGLFFVFDSINSEGLERLCYIILYTFLFSFGIIVLYFYIKNTDRFILKRNAKEIAWNIVKLVWGGLISCVVIISILIVDIATINVNYEKNGCITITNTSSYSYRGLEIQIYDAVTGSSLYEEDIEESLLLQAREEKFVNREVEGKFEKEGIMISEEVLHWKYIFDLKDIIETDGKYVILITAYQEGESVELGNVFMVERGKYVFARDTINKEY